MRFKHGITFSLIDVLRWFFALTIALAVILYALFQARFLIQGPKITLAYDIPHTTSDRTLSITGQAQNITSLTLDGKPIYTTDDGFFKETIIVGNGYTVHTLEAFDRYGNRERLERGIVYQES